MAWALEAPAQPFSDSCGHPETLHEYAITLESLVSQNGDDDGGLS